MDALRHLPSVDGGYADRDCGADERNILTVVSAMKVLNLYAGLGGNRKNWTGCEVTAVENHPKIAAIYQRLNPNDTVIIGDAHEYLLYNHQEFDFIWSSPPCQTHSRMMKATRHKLNRYPEMALYQEILFLKHFFKGNWVVENVIPYYEPLIEGKKMGRHMFWSNFAFTYFDVQRPKGFINQANLAGKQALMDWLGIYYEENIYYGSNHCPAQILRNCVHPKVGQHIFESLREPDFYADEMGL
jgi:DNA (cytosine-5)-methyltransferase 1